MRRIVNAILKRVVYALSIPVVLSEYFLPETGREYGIGFFTKLNLARLMWRNYREINTGSRVTDHLLMATQIMKIPRSIEGCVVECGSFKGGSAVNLSLACDLCGRRMEIFDSFAGLPEPSSADKQHRLLNVSQVHTYEKGAWKGVLDEVKANIAKYGRIEVCNFNVEYFDQTLPSFRTATVFAFLDVDLRESLETI